MELRAEVVVEAPASRVWDVLADFPAYHEWNPFITSIAGELAVGKALEVVLSLPEGGEMQIRPEIVRCEPEYELRWRRSLWFDSWFKSEHFFLLRPTQEGHTRVVHGENFGGFLVKFRGRLLTQTERGLVYMNRALKRRVEERGALTQVH